MKEIVELARSGMAVLFISAEIDEVVRVSDRIVVMRDRAKAGELPRGCDRRRGVLDDCAGAEHP